MNFCYQYGLRFIKLVLASDSYRVSLRIEKVIKAKMKIGSIEIRSFTIDVIVPLILTTMIAGCASAPAPQPNTVAQAGSAADICDQAPPPPPVEVPGAQFEAPPVISAADLIPAGAISGPGYCVGQMVPTNGAMGQYTIVLQSSVFPNDAGTYQVESLNLMKIRLSEIPAMQYLENMSKSELFVKSIGTAAERPVSDAVQMVSHPMDTVTGLPSGIGKLMGRVDLGANQLWSTAQNSSESGGERTEQVGEESGSITLTALGYEKDRRDLARKLNVDPYTTNPILKRQLNQAAWVIFSARIGVEAAMSVAVPGSMIISGVEATDGIVYETPKGDLILLVEKKLKSFGVAPEVIAAFSHNPAIPLSLQVTAVNTLDTLGDIPGRQAIVQQLAGLVTEYQARFVVSSLRMLVKYSQQNGPITALAVPGPVVGRAQDGTLVMPAPVDYLSWTERIAGFATSPAFLGSPNRVLWITGQMTPLARQQLAANGWKLLGNAQ
jgi:hypothetical protein